MDKLDDGLRRLVAALPTIKGMGGRDGRDHEEGSRDKCGEHIRGGGRRGGGRRAVSINTDKTAAMALLYARAASLSQGRVGPALRLMS
jgi:hypothetical protein